MALTITPAVTPDTTSLINGALLDGNKPIVVKAASSFSAQPNFYLLCRVYGSIYNAQEIQTAYTDTFTELLASARLIPASGDNFVNIDVAAIIRSQLVFNAQRLVDSAAVPTGLIKKYNLRFTEYFGTTPTASADNYYLLDDIGGDPFFAGLFAIKAGQKYQTWVQGQRYLPSGYDNFTMQAGGGSVLPLSNVPESILFKSDARVFLPIGPLSDFDENVYIRLMLLVRHNGVDYYRSFTAAYTSPLFFSALFPMSIADFNEWQSNGEWVDENGDPLNFPVLTNGSSFDAAASFGNNDDPPTYCYRASDWLSFTVADCSFDEGAQVHFINELGGVDSFPFKYRAGDEYLTLKQQFVAPINADTSFASYDRGGYDIEIQENQFITLTTDWLTQAQQDYLHQLISSTGVWIDLGGTAGAWQMLGVTIVETTYNAKNYVVDDMASLTVKFKVANAIYKGGMI